MIEYVPGLAGVPAAQSSISFVDGANGVLEYRGIRIEPLAEQSHYEETAFLLMKGHLPTESELGDFSRGIGHARCVPDALTDIIRSFPPSAHPMHALQTSVAALGMFVQPADYADPAQREDAALRITGAIPTLVAAFHRERSGHAPIKPDPTLSHAADFLRMLTGETPDELTAHVMDVALILHADHTLNASTFTARVTASSQSTPYAVVSAAIGSLSGSLHGGANENVLSMLREIGSKDKVRETITRKIAAREKIMGLGHRVYKTKDPRAYVLQSVARELFEARGRSAIYDVALELEQVAGELLNEKGIYPNVDFYSGIVYDKLAIPMDIFTPIFAVARAAGWLAHWLEQMADNRIFRPVQIYGGEHTMSYTPIGDR